MSTMIIVDRKETVLASLDGYENVFMPGKAGEEIESWVKDGVPSFEGTPGNLILERPVTISPKDPLWGLAVVEECKRRGWGIYEVNEKS